MQNETKLVLEQLYDLLNKPWAWTRHQYRKWEQRAPDGNAYCLVGGLQKIDGPHEQAARSALAQQINPHAHTYGQTHAITYFNDHSTKRDVLKLIRRTIKELSDNNTQTC